MFPVEMYKLLKQQMKVSPAKRRAKGKFTTIHLELFRGDWKNFSGSTIYDSYYHLLYLF